MTFGGWWKMPLLPNTGDKPVWWGMDTAKTGGDMAKVSSLPKSKYMWLHKQGYKLAYTTNVKAHTVGTAGLIGKYQVRKDGTLEFWLRSAVGETQEALMLIGCGVYKTHYPAADLPTTQISY